MGRAETLAQTLLAQVTAQTRPADRVLICATAPSDVAGIDLASYGAAVFMDAAPSTTGQRNRLLAAAEGCDIVAFFDDDFTPEPGYLAAIDRSFSAVPDIAVATGVVLADGAKGPGLTPDEARAALAAAPSCTPAALRDVFNAYGCNMVVNLARLAPAGTRFDERLPLYAWYEDIDFSRRAAKFGRIVRMPDARGVHLGVKRGRTSGVRLGYSQVINPIYLWRKGTYPFSHVLHSVGRHTLINAIRALRPESHIDRAGRLRGNAHGFADLLRGHIDPERVKAL